MSGDCSECAYQSKDAPTTNWDYEYMKNKQFRRETERLEHQIEWLQKELRNQAIALDKANQAIHDLEAGIAAQDEVLTAQINEARADLAQANAKIAALRLWMKDKHGVSDDESLLISLFYEGKERE